MTASPKRPLSTLLLPRVAGALALRVGTYAEVAASPEAGFQAAFVVMLVGVCEGAVYGIGHGEETMSGSLLLLSLFAAMIGWVLWTAVVYFVGRVFRHSRDFGAIARAVGFAHAPSLLFGMTLLPVLALVPETLRTISLVWFVAAVFAAVRGVYSLGPAPALRIMAVCLLGRLLLEAAIKASGL